MELGRVAALHAVVELKRIKLIVFLLLVSPLIIVFALDHRSSLNLVMLKLAPIINGNTLAIGVPARYPAVVEFKLEVYDVLIP